MSVGLYAVRYRRKKLGVSRSEFRAWDISVIFTILVNVYLLVMPWYPPTGGANGGDVSFWYATYCVVGIAILVVCGIYYYAWIYLLPKIGHYKVMQEVLNFEDGSSSHALVKVPNSELERWDQEHDAHGRLILQGVALNTPDQKGKEKVSVASV